MDVVVSSLLLCGWAVVVVIASATMIILIDLVFEEVNISIAAVYPSRAATPREPPVVVRRGVECHHNRVDRK